MKRFSLWRHRKKGLAYNGFALFELIITVALMGCIAGFYVYLFSFTRIGAVKREVDRLSMAIRYMQRKAILERTPCRLLLNPLKRTYTTDTEYKLSSDVCFGIKKGVMGPPSAPTHLLTSPISWPSNCILCYPDGTISAGAVYLTDASRSCLYALTCDASAVTHVRKYRHYSKWTLVQ